MKALSLLLLVGALAVTVSAAPYVQDLLNAEHFDDIYFESDGGRTARFDGVLVMYAPQCEQEMKDLSMSYRTSPPLNFVLLMRYDYVTAKKAAWFNFSAEFDLHLRYPTTECMTVFFLPKNNYTNPVVWDKSGKLSDWLWQRVAAKVTFFNVHVRTVNIYWHGANGDVKVATAHPTDEVFVNTFISHKLYAVDATNNAFLDGWVISRDVARYVQTIDEPNRRTPASFAVWHEKIAADYKDQEELIEQEIWSHAVRHLTLIKQVPMLPPFTEKGYKKVNQPAEVFKMLHDFWKNNRENKLRIENWDKGATQINFDKVKTAMIDLPDKTKRAIAAIVKPQLEEWSGVKLEYQMLYGIREYYNGSILKKHVDRVETHVISVILNIAQDVDEDWVLEVLSWDGKNVRIPQKAGEMIFYESARLNHGRPYPLIGRYYASAFLHFAPVSGWKGVYSFGVENSFHFRDQKVPLQPGTAIGRPFVKSDLEKYPLPFIRKDEL